MRRIVLTILLCLLLSYPALAGTISITTTAKSSVLKGGEGNMTLKILNSGDEAAYNVDLSIQSQIFETDSIEVGLLKPNIPFEETLDVELKGGLLTGTYSEYLLIKYQDANGYQFSAVSPLVLNNERVTESKISGKFDPLTLEGRDEKSMFLEITNNDELPHEIKVRLVASNDLSVKGQEKTLLIGPKETKKTSFRISNLSGLDGSRYVVLALVEYEDSFHHSTIINGVAEIKEASNGGKSSVSGLATLATYSSAIIAIVLAVSVLAILYYFFGKHIKAKSEKK
ncbi:hypothetical protein A3K63_03925 [Candidatus Micrarchaeota archaeon RBG_16_49_10]|nr:MAG: hypothetical protein A3K63_03925 [Candidatus Micrarchaeota archaeon RBG_16_49_10]